VTFPRFEGKLAETTTHAHDIEWLAQRQTYPIYFIHDLASFFAPADDRGCPKS
jgi:hypothetical protein